jgi:hypothetical protein
MKNIEIMVRLKESGFPQKLTKGDYIYLIDKKDYVKFDGGDIPDNYLRLPQLSTLVGALENEDYSLNHQVLGIGKETWEIIHKNIIIKGEFIWEVLAEFWINKYGK